MNKLYMLFALLVFSAASAQQDEPQKEKARKPFSAIPQIRFYGYYPIHFGDRQFAKAYNAGPGFGFNLSPVRYRDFRLNLGFERVVYNVSDHTLIAQPVSHSSYQSLFSEVSYSIGSEDSFCIKPSAGIGGSILYLKTGSTRFGNQNAFDFRAGLTADWAVYKHLSLFLTARYVHSNIDVDTSGEFRDFYSKANSVQVGAGIVIR